MILVSSHIVASSFACWKCLCTTIPDIITNAWVCYFSHHLDLLTIMIVDQLHLQLWLSMADSCKFTLLLGYIYLFFILLYMLPKAVSWKSVWCMAGLDNLSRLTGLTLVVRGKTPQVNSSVPFLLLLCCSVSHLYFVV